MNRTEDRPRLTHTMRDLPATDTLAEAIAPPAGWTRYEQRGFWPRWRMRLTLLSMIGLLVASWIWGRRDVATWFYIPGVLFTATGIAVRLWAAGWLRKHESLMTMGPYALIRHPLYLGTFLIFIGHGFMSCLVPGLLIVGVAWMLLYWPAVREEEEFLIAKYGDEYLEYQANVPALIPRLARFSCGERNDNEPRFSFADFSWRQVLRNREYEGTLVNSLMILLYAWLNILPAMSP